MAEQNFLSMKTDIAGINSYLEQQGVKLSEQESKQLNTIFETCDTYDDENNKAGKDSKLNFKELGDFYNRLKSEMPKLQQFIQETIKSINMKKVEEDLAQQEHPTSRDATSVAPIKNPEKEVFMRNTTTQNNMSIQSKTSEANTFEMIKSEALKYKKKLNENDIKYWTEKIHSVAQKFNIPEALLVSIIGKETKFVKNQNSANGAGPMQVTLISIKDFFPSSKNDWYKIYKNMDGELLNDILYKKDKNGNFLKDNKGNYILKYSSPEKLRAACAQNDELGIKVGLLCFEMKYVKAVAQKKFGRATFSNLPKAIKNIQNGEITLSEKENKSCIKTALKNYNSVFSEYANTLIDSLSTHGLDFKNLYFIK